MNRKKLILAMLAIVVVLAALAFGVYALLNNHDITTSANPTDYAKNTSLDGVTFWMSKQWTTVDLSTTDRIDAFNYDAGKVRAELAADGRLPQNANFYDDVVRRDLKTYPYSLDKMYQVQLYATDSYSTKQLSQAEVLASNDPSSVTDLQFYHVNGKLVADYIQKGMGRAINQRIILMRDSTGRKEFRVTINPDQSRRTITKDNFDGLMELVGSVTFN